MSAYSRELVIDATGGVTQCVELPSHMRGSLERIIIKQVGGVAAGATFTIYNRRGACTTGWDLNVSGGNISATANNGGKAQFTTDTEHGLLPGDTVWVKTTGQALYDDMYHVVLSVESATQFTVTTDYATAVSSGIWQTAPLDDYPIVDPVAHKVYAGTVTASQVTEVFNLNYEYENRDNQHVTARRRAQALWMHFVPAGTGAQQWLIAVTTVSPCLTPNG